MMREDAPRRKVSGTFVVTEGGLEPVLLRSLSRPQRTALGWSESTTKTAAKKKQNVQQFSSSLCFFSGSSSKKCRVYLACVRARTRAYIIRAVLVRVSCTSIYDYKRTHWPNFRLLVVYGHLSRARTYASEDN